MPDFENNEIQDSAFPVEFNDEHEALDMYGVWVKSGPRDISAYDEPSESMDSMDEEAVLPVFDSVPDISEFDELPDFDISLDEFDSENDEPIDSGNEAEDLVSEEDIAEPVAELGSDDESGDTDEPGETDESADAEESVEFGGDIEIAELAGEDDTVSDELPDFDISLDEFDDESGDQVSEEEVFVEELDIARDSSAETPEMEEAESIDEAPSSDEVDLSAFLNEFEASSPSPSSGSEENVFDDLDLDDFINEINESGGSSDKDKEKLFDDAEPVDIDLEFDEEFIENSEKIRAAGSRISEPEFESSEFGVEFVDETDSDSDYSDFETAYMEDEKEDDQPHVVSAVESDLEEATEFDDLLASLDDAKPSVDRTEDKTEKQTADFNLMVTEEDGLESLVSAAPQSTGNDEDVAVPLFGDAEEIDSDGLIDMDQDISDEEQPEEIETVDSDDALIVEESSSSPETGTVIDFGDDIVVEDMEIVEKDNLDITEDSDYNEAQSGADSVDQIQDVSIDFDDVGAFEESLHESGTDTGEYDVTSNDKSTELLMLIAEELSSIKKELSSLNTELSTAKKTPQIHDDSDEDIQDTESGNTGFFSDDDTDETIALTGDELNNILITADFTEEKTEESAKNEDASDTTEDTVDDDTTTVADLSDEFSIDIPLEDDSDWAESSPAESVEQDVTADFTPPPEDDATDSDIVFDDEQDDIVAEEHDIPEVLSDDIFGTGNEQPIEATHVNKIDEDISYLDGDESIEPDLDDVAIEEPDIETLDFNDDNLEEPELTEFNIDLSEMEQETEHGDDDSVNSAEEAVDIPVETESLDDVETGVAALPLELKDEIKSVLSYMDQLLESLPEEKIEEFARSEHFDVYKKLFEELGIS